MKKIYFWILLIFFFFNLPLNADTIDPYEIFHRYYQATGGLQNHKRIKTRYISGRVQQDNLKGHFKSWSETPLRYYAAQDFNIIREQSGDNGQQLWHKDSNGKVQLIKDPESLERRRIRNLMAFYEHLKKNSPYFKLRYIGQSVINHRQVEVIELANTINSDSSRFFFDAENYQLLKSIEKQPDVEIHSSYSDYRKVDGDIIIPFRTESEVKPRNKFETTVIEEFIANLSVDARHYQIPAESLSPVHFRHGDHSGNIKFELFDNIIYLPTRLKDDEKVWVFDSGASQSVIDEDYARQMGLTIHPGIKGFGFGGTFDLAYTRLPLYGPGGALVENQTVYAMKNLAQRFDKENVVGILGYDFLSRFVVKIDYAQQTIALFSPQTFKYSGNGSLISAPLKYNTFTLPITINEQYTGTWSLDLGAYDSSLHFLYSQQQGFHHLPGVETISAGASGVVLEKKVKFDSVKIGRHTISPVYLNFPLQEGSGASRGGEIAGNLGNSILQRFVLYLDYQNQQLIFEPGEDFKIHIPQDRSGITLSYSEEDGYPFIAHISPGSPAAETDLLPGDDIIAVNQQQTQGLEQLITVREALMATDDKPVRLTIRRQGGNHQVMLKLRNLF